MNTIKVTVELCAEDRARLDKILEALTNAGTPFPAAPATTQKEELPGQMSIFEGEPAEPEKAPWAEAEPAPEVKQSDIQKKVVDLSAAGKKDQVREIIKAYADRVSAIPEDKLNEVWAKLKALEG